MGRLNIFTIVVLLVGCESGQGSQTDSESAESEPTSTAEMTDCRTDGLGCRAPFECLADEGGVFSCRRDGVRPNGENLLDCRNDGRGCTAPFECEETGDELFECVRSEDHTTDMSSGGSSGGLMNDGGSDGAAGFIGGGSTEQAGPVAGSAYDAGTDLDEDQQDAAGASADAMDSTNVPDESGLAGAQG